MMSRAIDIPPIQLRIDEITTAMIARHSETVPLAERSSGGVQDQPASGG
jgi:hypothetical protein